MTFGGQGLLERTVYEAHASGLFEQVIVSTDDPELTQRALKCGASVPFNRPPELALDETSSWEVVSDLVRKLDYVGDLMLLQVTSPLRNSGHLLEATAMRTQHHDIRTISVNYDDQVTGNAQRHLWCNCHPLITTSKTCEKSKFISPNGAIYILHTREIPTSHTLNLNGCLGYLMSAG